MTVAQEVFWDNSEKMEALDIEIRYYPGLYLAQKNCFMGSWFPKVFVLYNSDTCALMIAVTVQN